MDLLAPMVTMYWNWDQLNPNRSTFSSNDCNMDVIKELNSSSNLSNSDSKLIYYSQYSRNTLTEKLDLVCHRSWLVSFAGFVFIIGSTLGAFLIRLTEIFGRRPIILLSAALSLLSNICMLFPANYVMFVVAIGLFRASVHQIHMLLFIQAAEIITSSRRQYVGVWVKSGLLIGQTVLVCASWFLMDWFYTQLFQTVLVAILLPVVWYLQESPAFLAVRGKYEDARQVIMKIVQRNGQNANEFESKIDSWLEQMKVRCEIETKAEEGSLKDLFKNRKISFYTFGLTFTYFSTAFIFTGLVLNAESFGSGLYIDLTTSNAFSLLSVLIVAALLTKMSLRIILCVSFLLEGLTCVVYTFTYGFPLARTIVSVLNRSFISAVYANSRIYMNEVFPTSVRGVGSGFTVFVGSILSSSSPFTKELGVKTYPFVPFVLFAVLSLISALLYHLMPETRKKPLADTIHDLHGLHGKEKEKKTQKTSVHIP